MNEERKKNFIIAIWEKVKKAMHKGFMQKETERDLNISKWEK